MNPIFKIALCLFIFVFGPTSVYAAPDEIEVYTDEISKPADYGLELHMNHSMVGTQTAGYPGQMPSDHISQATPEFYYGLTPTLEAGLYLPMSTDTRGNSNINGLRVRLKYIAPHEHEDELFWGVNGEIGHASVRSSQSAGVAEIRPIIGYRSNGWLASFNPILNMGLSSNVSHIPNFEPSLKLTHSLIGQIHAGAEYYGEYGPINQMLPSNQRSHTLYGVIDVENADYDLNFGLGRGNVNATDRWMLKAVATVPFD